jgi:3-hydroxymyristoyl/3-hydroxydecanoyl-(acyl carrier protein) dehydratase
MNKHHIEQEKVISEKNNSIFLEFKIAAESDFFDGHFPDFKLLPAVAQFYIAVHFSEKYLSIQNYVPSFRRIKFTAPVRPNSMLHLKLDKNSSRQQVKFALSSQDEKTMYSSGSFSITEKES